MNYQHQAAIIANDLASMVIRIEALQARPGFTAAQNAVEEARKAVLSASAEIHERETKARYAKMDAA